MLDGGRPLQEVPGGVLLGAGIVHGQRPDPHVGRGCSRCRVGRERRIAQVAGFLVVAAVHEVAEDVGVEDHGGSARTEVGADLVPGVGGPVLRARVLDHLDPVLVEGLGARRVHRRLQLAVGDVEVLLAEVGIAREEARVDGRPAARTADADAIRPTEVLGQLGRDFDHLAHVLRGLHADLVEHLLVVGDVVELEAPRDAPLLGIRRTELAARNAVPRGGSAKPRQHVFPIVVGIGLGRVLDELVEVGDPAGRTIGPGHVGASHEGIILGRARREGRRHLVEVDVLGEDVPGDVHAGHVLEGLDIGDHGIGIGMLVEQKLELRALVLHPVEIGGHGAGLRLAQEHAGCRGRKAQLACTIDHFAAADLLRHEGVEEAFFFLEHSHSSVGLWGLLG